MTVIWAFPKIGGKPPKWMVKIMENPIKMDDLGGKPTIFGNIHIVLELGLKQLWNNEEFLNTPTDWKRVRQVVCEHFTCFEVEEFESLYFISRCSINTNQ